VLNALWKKFGVPLSMAKHYYNIEVVTEIPWDEDDINDVEGSLRAGDLGVLRVVTEYVDSEG
jgi:hypothetical protein